MKTWVWPWNLSNKSDNVYMSRLLSRQVSVKKEKKQKSKVNELIKNEGRLDYF